MKRSLLAISIIAWAAVIGCGLFWLTDYASRPGPQGSVPRTWPSDSTVSRSDSSLTLVIALHPRCACSQASVSELARLQARTGGKLAIRALLVKPSNARGGEWERSSLWERVMEIPGVSASLDPGGAEARRFGIGTSGHVVVYDLRGRLAFSGGVTASRGHEGDNMGSEAIAEIAHQRRPATESTRVFGCSLSSGPDRGENP
jgi:hypothetical protein